ncbi:MAG: hypothetical protein IT235_07410 [Bacteroidia bacterium]|nr:hypothetical protein [Bacteroidia bacterium]
MRKTFFVLVLILPTIVFSQRRNRYKYEWIGGIGITNFLGDLGGANQVGTHLVRDWEWAATRPSFTAGIRYKNSRHIGYKAALSFGMMYGNDALTTEPVRNNRNLNFRSPVVELSTQVEFYVNKETQGRLYRIKNARGKRRLDLQGYVFGGLGFLWFNPQGKYKGSWINLRPLSTEGQGLPGGPPKYAPVTMSFPFGVGAKYGLDSKWSIGLEIGLHYTLSDYIDDVHGVYYDNATILKDKGAVAAYMADPQLGKIPSQSYAGQDRGHKYRDAFMFGMVNINYKVMYRRRTRSKF